MQVCVHGELTFVSVHDISAALNSKHMKCNEVTGDNQEKIRVVVSLFFIEKLRVKNGSSFCHA